MFIYRFTNLINNKIYIGQTTQSFETRLNQHFSGAKFKSKNNKCGYFQNALIKYGKENFKVEIILSCLDKEYLDEFEIFFIQLFESSNPSKGYNTKLGGGRSSFTIEVRQKLSKSHRGLKHTPEQKINHKRAMEQRDQTGSKNPFKGKKHSKECLEKRSLKVSKLYKITSAKEEIIVRGWASLIEYFKQNNTSQYLVAKGKTDFRYECLG